MENTRIDVGSLTVDQATDLLKQLEAKLGVTLKKPGLGRLPKLDYASLDWSKKNKELAAETGVGYGVICKWRRLLGKPRVCGGKHYPACQSWDWSKSDTEIARENGVSVLVAKIWRRNLNKPLHPRDSHRIYTRANGDTYPKFDLSSVDWTLWDKAIADKVGCTREYVRQKRAELGKPKALFWERFYAAFTQEFSGRTELSYAECRAKFPKMSHWSFKGYCSRAGIKSIRTYTKPCHHPWHLVNWDLPNIVLGSIWGITTSTVAMRRSNHLAKKAAFKSTHGSIPDEWVLVVDQEKQKSSEYLASKNGNGVAH